MSGEPMAVFLSYASEDAGGAARIAGALQAAGIEVWFDRNELRGGDAWDQSIRTRIRDCALFIPLISARSQARSEGYFRLEWRLAEQRSLQMGRHRSFILPVCLDGTPERDADVPDAFLAVQWVRMRDGEVTTGFAERVAALIAGTSAHVAAGPSGRAADSPLAAPAHAGGKRRSRTLLAAGIPVLLAAIAVGFWLLGHSRQRPAAPTSEAIAVLPFADLSPGHDEAYLSDGLAQEVAVALGQVQGLRVLGHASSLRFKDSRETPATIGAQLGARFLVEGGVRRSADRLRVTVKLVDASDGTDRWSGTIERDAAEVRDVESAIAVSIARSLQLELRADPTDRGAVRVSRDAYDAYLRGWHALEQGDRSSTEQAIVHLRRALQLEPRFAAAADRLAVAVMVRVDNDFVASTDGWADARKAAEDALRINPDSGVAHAVLGAAALIYDWDWETARREFDAALAHDSTDRPFVLLRAAEYSLVAGRLDEAAQRLEAAEATDPLSPNFGLIKVWVYQRQGRIDDALHAAERALAISPSLPWVRYYATSVLLDAGRGTDALAEANAEPHVGARLAARADALWALGRRDESSHALAELERDNAADMPMEIAEAYAFRGDAAKALEWLETARRNHDGDLFYVRGDPFFRSIAGDARYRAFLDRMGLAR